MITADTILELVDARRGHFRMESGYHVAQWLELDALFVRPDRVRPIAAALARLLAPHGPEAVCGPLVGGALVAQLVAVELGCEMYFAERATTDAPGELYGELYAARYRLSRSLAGRVRGKRVAIVDDVISAGSSVRATFAELVERGATPVAVGALLLMGEAAPRWFAERGLRVEACARTGIEMWTPDACPLCRAGAPLEG